MSDAERADLLSTAGRLSAAALLVRGGDRALLDDLRDAICGYVRAAPACDVAGIASYVALILRGVAGEDALGELADGVMTERVRRAVRHTIRTDGTEG